MIDRAEAAPDYSCFTPCGVLRGPRPKTFVRQQFCALGEDAEAFLVGGAAIGNTRLASKLEILLSRRAAQARMR